MMQQTKCSKYEITSVLMLV